METFNDYYRVLGVDERASSDTIKAAFKKLALQYHPDVYKGEDAQERMRVLLLAYQTLSDPDERRSYDRQRAGHLGYAYEDPGVVSHSAGAGVAPAPTHAKKGPAMRALFSPKWMRRALAPSNSCLRALPIRSGLTMRCF